MVAKWFVYIVECVDESLYTGITFDESTSRRIDQHNRGVGSKYTRSRVPVKQVWSREVSNKSTALKLEFRIKKLSREDKLKLISGDLNEQILERI